MCKSDHGLTWTEFCDLTLAGLEALEDRRAIRLRHARFDAGLIAAVLINSRRTSTEGEALTPYDFIEGWQPTELETRARQLRKGMKQAISGSMMRLRLAGPEAVQAEKARLIESVRGAGIEDAEELFAEVFPNL